LSKAPPSSAKTVTPEKWLVELFVESLLALPPAGADVLGALLSPEVRKQLKLLSSEAVLFDDEEGSTELVGFMFQNNRRWWLVFREGAEWSVSDPIPRRGPFPGRGARRRLTRIPPRTKLLPFYRSLLSRVNALREHLQRAKSREQISNLAQARALLGRVLPRQWTNHPRVGLTPMIVDGEIVASACGRSLNILVEDLVRGRFEPRALTLAYLSAVLQGQPTIEALRTVLFRPTKSRTIH
jgi:hypothetical protein